MDEEAQAAAAAAAEAAAAAAAAEAEKNKANPDAAELERLRAELASRDATLAQFEGLDPAAAKAAIAQKAAAEAAQSAAERAKAEAEGNWERVRELMNEEHAAKVAALTAENETLKTGRTAAEQRLDQLTVDRAFGDSTFLREKVALPAAKVRQLFSAHVDVVDGALVVFDKPRGEANRTTIVDPKGKPLGFEAAIEKVISTDPDKDSLLATTAKPGSAAKPHGATDATAPVGRHQIFAEGFKALREQGRR